MLLILLLGITSFSAPGPLHTPFLLPRELSLSSYIRPTSYSSECGSASSQTHGAFPADWVSLQWALHSGSVFGHSSHTGEWGPPRPLGPPPGSFLVRSIALACGSLGGRDICKLTCSIPNTDSSSPSRRCVPFLSPSGNRSDSII